MKEKETEKEWTIFKYTKSDERRILQIVHINLIILE